MTLQEAIDSLPGTPDQIHALLKTRGVNGHRFSYTCCPISRYLSRQTNFPIVTGGSKAWPRYRRGESTLLPPSAYSFIRLFDRGAYPDLDEGRPLPAGNWSFPNKETTP